ncbi:MAG: hypothetical protein AAGH19_06960, partial [Pseudomonadota bacterium]
HADEDRAAMAQAQMQETIERLELTDDQLEQAKPVLQSAASEQQEILKRYEMDPESRENATSKPGFRQLRAMRKEMTAVRENTLEALDPILSEAQMEELKLIQEERRAEMRARIQASR